jgi:hypothetical protein
MQFRTFVLLIVSAIASILLLASAIGGPIIVSPHESTEIHNARVAYASPGVYLNTVTYADRHAPSPTNIVYYLPGGCLVQGSLIDEPEYVKFFCLGRLFSKYRLLHRQY